MARYTKFDHVDQISRDEMEAIYAEVKAELAGAMTLEAAEALFEQAEHEYLHDRVNTKLDSDPYVYRRNMASQHLHNVRSGGSYFGPVCAMTGIDYSALAK